MNSVAAVRLCTHPLEKWWKIWKLEMLNKTCAYIAVFKKEDGKAWKENPSESAFLNEYSEKNTLLLYVEIFLKLPLNALFQLGIGCILGLWINLTARIVGYSLRHIIY